MKDTGGVTKLLAVRAKAPADLPLPGPATGLRWRLLQATDNDDLAALIARAEQVDNPPYRTTPPETAQLLSPDANWSGAAGFDDTGIMRAYVHVLIKRTNVLQASCSGAVDPMWRSRGAGGAGLNWQVGRARQMLAQFDTDEDARIVVHVDEGLVELGEHLQALGFHMHRTYSELRRDLLVPIPTVETSRYLKVYPWSVDLDDTVRRAHNKLTAQSWGSPPITAQEWNSGRTFFAPQWSFVAMDKSSDRAEIVGYLLAGRYEQDWPVLGWSEGYVDMLGVMPDWVSTNVATALVTASMQACAADGMDYCAVGLASDSSSGALMLYQELGFVPYGLSRMFAIDL